MHRQACFHSGMHSNNGGRGSHFLSLAYSLRTLYRFFLSTIFFLTLIFMFPLRTMSFSRFGIVCFFIVFHLSSFATVIYCHFGRCHTIIPPHRFSYPASLSFIRRLLFTSSLSLSNVGVFVGCWLAAE